MSLFYCQECDELRDSDDGCEEMSGGLVCEDCADNLREIRGECVEAAQ